MEPNTKRKAYLMVRTHMDSLWRRGWSRETRHKGEILRSYRQIQNGQIRAGLDLAEKTGIPFPLEQVLNLAAYLEDHPDERARLVDLEARGLFEPLGGGITVPDTHLPDGETLVRNHLYGRRWLAALFGRAPRGASIPDAFGLSGQLAQVFKGVGYDEVDEYSRVFGGPAAFWRGLDGSVLPLIKPGKEPGWGHATLGPAGRYPACPACRGAGCPVCGHTGLDETENDRQASAWAWGRFKDQLKRAEASGAREIAVGLWAEEIMEDGKNVEAARAHLVAEGYEVSTLGWRGIRDRLFANRREQARSGGAIAAGELVGPESSPVGTGGYLTRIAFKQKTRELEDLLQTAEKIAVLSGLAPYPRKEIERLWWQVSLLTFHDCITGTHTDGAGEELNEVLRAATHGAAQIVRRAMAAWEKQVAIPAKEGYTPFVVANPWNWTVAGEIITHMAEVGRTMPAPEGAEVVDQNGKPLDVLSVTPHAFKNGHRLEIRFRAPEMKPLSLTAIYWRPAAARAPAEVMTGDVMENGFYRIRFQGGRITEVFDKEAGAVIGGPSFGSLEVEHDLGSPWETLAEPVLNRCLSDERGVTTAFESCPGGRRLVFSGQYRNLDNMRVHGCAWRQTVTLLDGEKRIRFLTEVTWEGENARVSARFPMSFRTPEDRAVYEIPYGSLERPSYKPTYGVHLCANGDHPGQRVLACEDRSRNLTVALLVKGLPAQRVENGAMRLGLLRSPGEPLHVFDIDGSRETGDHVFEYAITSVKGDFAGSRLLHEGRTFTSPWPTCGASAHGATGPAQVALPLPEFPVILTVVKKAEGGEDIILRGYDGYGNGGRWPVPNGCPAERKNLDEETGVAGDSVRPHEIATVRVKAG